MPYTFRAFDTTLTWLGRDATVRRLSLAASAQLLIETFTRRMRLFTSISISSPVCTQADSAASRRLRGDVTNRKCQRYHPRNDRQ